MKPKLYEVNHRKALADLKFSNQLLQAKLRNLELTNAINGQITDDISLNGARWMDVCLPDVGIVRLLSTKIEKE